MIKWLALFFAVLALFSAADEKKVKHSFDQVEGRLDAIESSKCTLMVVLTPSGSTTICAHQ